jgi:uncharacterized membrane protein
MRPKGILAYLITPILYLCIRLLMMKWVFITVFALAWIAIIVFLLRKTIYYFTPQKFRSEKEEIIEAEIVESTIDEHTVLSENQTAKSAKAEFHTPHTCPTQETTYGPQQLNPPHIDTRSTATSATDHEQQKRDRKLLLLQRISFYAALYNLIFCLFLIIQKAYWQSAENDGIIDLFGSFQIKSIVCLFITAIICKLFDTLNKLTDLIRMEKKGYKLLLFTLLAISCFFYFKTDFSTLQSLIIQSYIKQGVFFLLGIVTFLLAQLTFMTIDYPSFIQYQFSRKRDLKVIIILNLFLFVLVMIIAEILLKKYENMFDSSHLFALYPTVLLFFLERKNYLQAKNYVNRLDSES